MTNPIRIKIITFNACDWYDAVTMLTLLAIHLLAISAWIVQGRRETTTSWDFIKSSSMSGLSCTLRRTGSVLSYLDESVSASDYIYINRVNMIGNMNWW